MSESAPPGARFSMGERAPWPDQHPGVHYVVCGYVPHDKIPGGFAYELERRHGENPCGYALVGADRLHALTGGT